MLVQKTHTHKQTIENRELSKREKKKTIRTQATKVNWKSTNQQSRMSFKVLFVNCTDELKTTVLQLFLCVVDVCLDAKNQLYTSGEDVELFIFRMASTFRLILTVEQTVKWLWLRSPLNAKAFNGSVHTSLPFIQYMLKRFELFFAAIFQQHFVWYEKSCVQSFRRRWTLFNVENINTHCTRVDFGALSLHLTFDFQLFSTLNCLLRKHFVLDKWKLASFKWFRSINIPNFREYFR